MPALRDSGGFVVLEALSNGLPVATLNLGGPGEIINNKCGIKINVINKDENFVTERLYKSIAKLISNKKQYQKIKNYTKKRTRKFLWQQKINKIYK
jgi:glycosyltransferase involved in cell wall biosynthesis